MMILFGQARLNKTHIFFYYKKAFQRRLVLKHKFSIEFCLINKNEGIKHPLGIKQEMILDAFFGMHVRKKIRFTKRS